MNLLSRILYYFHPERDEIIQEVEQKINYTFKNPSLLKKALTHRSLYSEPEKNYERLEFLGDAILDFTVSEWLFNKDVKMNEGELTKKRAALVNSTFLGMIGQKLDLINYVYVNPGLDTNDSKVIQNISADVYESIVGAVFLDTGRESVIKFIHRSLIQFHDQAEKDSNYKGSLIEFCHAKGIISPKFLLTSSTGPEHNKLFHIEVIFGDGKKYGGTGYTKKIAEQNAAKLALESMRKI